MAETLPEVARKLFDQPVFATLATLEPDGRPQLSVVWVERDGDDVLVSTTVGRRKHQNLQRDPRVTVLVQPADAPYAYVEVRGRVSTMTQEPDDPDARALIDRMAKAYLGADRYPMDDQSGELRVKVRIAADRVVVRGL